MLSIFHKISLTSFPSEPLMPFGFVVDLLDVCEVSASHTLPPICLINSALFSRHTNVLNYIGPKIMARQLGRIGGPLAIDFY